MTKYYKIIMTNDYTIVSNKPEVLYIDIKKISSRIDCTPFRIDHIKSEEILNKSGLQTITLGKLITSKNSITGGATPLGAIYPKEGIRFIRTQDVGINYINPEKCVYISNNDNKKLKRSQLNSGNVILTITGANFGRSAVVNSELLPANISQHSVRMNFKSEIDPYFISTYLNSYYGQSQIFRNTVGATRPAIDYEGIRSILIPIPSFEIQKYIGDKVRKAEKLRNEAMELLKSANRTFEESLPHNEIFEIITSDSKLSFIKPDQIDVNRLDAQYNQKKYFQFLHYCKQKNLSLFPLRSFLSEDLKSGSTPSVINFSGRCIPFLKANNIQNYSLDNEIVLINELHESELGRSAVKPGDVVLTIAGTIGNAAIIPENHPKLFINQALMRIRSESINNHYLVFVLNSQISKFFSLRNSNGAVQLNLNKKEVENILIMRIGEEKEIEIGGKICNYIKKIEHSKDLLQSAVKDVEDLIDGNLEMKKE